MPTSVLLLKPQDLEYLDLIWSMNFEWENNWSTWKTGQFSELQTAEMENLANTVFRKFAKLARDLKVKYISILL
ncbi:unnamed protein product [Echinostoma caproni]|uniref:Uncharacterized protein n=1 Tax=Echinostoma caproni TaxID=27848 RepID=A0A183A373_9TREM|nr:unnamed protein product [Echinostoma caproni]